MAPAPSVDLPPYAWRPSPNFSGRRGVVPHLVVVHRPVGSFESAYQALTDDERPPDDRVSAHTLIGHPNGGPVRCWQLVAWDAKAWACRGFNSSSYNLEVADDAWTGDDVESFRAAARLVAFLCARTGIPPLWTHVPTHDPGVVRHYDLGVAGGGHTDPTTDDAIWRSFMARVQFEFRANATGRHPFRRTYGKGRLYRLSV